MPKKINLKGPLVSNNDYEAYQYWGLEAVSAKSIAESLPEDNSDVVIEVNSNGGLVTVGSEIYTTLAKYPGNVTVEVVGMAASAASVAIMGADKVLMSPTAQIMIHKASFNYVSGNSDDLDKASNALKSSDKSIVNAYARKTNLSENELLELMTNETFMDATTAIEKGFADEVMEFEKQTNVESDLEIVASVGNGMLPKKLINDYFEKKQNDKEIQAMLFELEKEEILNGL